MAKKLKAAVIGTGMGRFHARSYAANKKVDLVALCDLNKPEAEWLAGELGVPHVFDNYAQMLHSVKLDIVSVVVPNHLHAPMTLDALERGIHVLCEKPLATTVADGEAMVALAEKQNLRLMVNLCSRFDPVNATVAKMVRDGDLGEVYYVRGGMMRRRGTPRLDFDSSGDLGRGAWFVQAEKAGGGALMDIGVHILDLCWWLAGCPAPVAVSGATFPDFRQAEFAKQKVRGDVDNGAAATIRCENGAQIFFEATWASNMKDEHYCKVYGTKAGASAMGEAMFYTTKAGKPADKPITPIPGITKDSYEHFVDAVLDPSIELNASGAGGLTILRILDAIRQAGRDGADTYLCDCCC